MGKKPTCAKKKRAQNCWEYWKCSKKIRDKCPAYLNDCGKECWMVAGTSTGSKYCPRLKHQFKFCWECPWFKKCNPDFDENEKNQMKKECKPIKKKKK